MLSIYYRTRYTDIILTDRKNEYYENNMTLCEENCDYNGYDYETKKAKCECKIKESFLSIFEINFDTDKLIEFFNVKNTINIYVIKCYKLLFSKDGLIKNIASYILLFIILINIPLLITFILKEFHILNQLINDIIKTNENWKNQINNNNENKWIRKKNEINITNLKSKRISLKNSLKNSLFLKLKNKFLNNPPKSKEIKPNNVF